MKQWILLAGSSLLLASCGLFHSQSSGCPTNGKNIGAERLLSGDPKAIKAAAKAGKFAN